jgi:hypothetical protein
MYGIGARVLGKWGASWFPGTIDQINGDQFFVRFDDGDTAWVTVTGLQPEAGYPVGARIRRLWTDGQYYLGTVHELSGRDIFVHFDDGDTAWLAPQEVEPEMPLGGKGVTPPGIGMPPSMGKTGGAIYSPGMRVQAQWTDGNWYGATISQVGGPDSFFVTYDDGYTAWLQAHQIQSEMSKGGVPIGKGFAPQSKGMMGGSAYTVGMRVQAQWTDGNWYGATITQVEGADKLFVTYDDGYTAWLQAHQIQMGK